VNGREIGFLILGLVIGLAIGVTLSANNQGSGVASLTTDPFVGTWVNSCAVGESTISLNSDGTGSVYGFVFGDAKEFTWHAEDNRVVADGGNTSRFFDDFHTPKLTPDKRALMYGGDTYVKQTE